MFKELISTGDAPSAIGPYSQGIRVGNFLFLSGQIPLDPKTGNVVGTTIVEQTEQVMRNIAAVLRSQEASFDNVVKVTVFLKNMADFPKFNEIYGGHLKKPFPARSTVEVARLPKDVLVEIEVLSFVP